MALEEIRIISGFIIVFGVLICSICARVYSQRQAKERIRRYRTNIITSQTRPLIIYHVPISWHQEPPPSYAQSIVSN